MEPVTARSSMPRFVLIAIFVIAMMLVAAAGCGPAPDVSDGMGTGGDIDDNGSGDPGDGSSEDPGDGDGIGDDGDPDGGNDGSVRWTVLEDGDLSEKAAQWAEDYKEETGIFQDMFGDETLILVSWGMKPTSGYSLTVTDVEENEDGELLITVVLAEPSEEDGGAVLPVETYPRAIVSIAPAGAYTVNPTFEGAAFFQNGSFQIEEPSAFAVIDDALRLKGRARVFESTFSVYLEDGHLELLNEIVTAGWDPDSDGDEGWAEFDVSLDLEAVPSSPNGFLAIWAESAKDGSKLDRINIPVRFAHWE